MGSLIQIPRPGEFQPWLREQYGLTPVAAFVGSFGLVEAVSKKPLTVATNVSRGRATPYGPAIGCLAVQSHVKASVVDLQKITTGGLSFLWRGIIVGDGAGENPKIGALQTSATSQKNDQFGFTRVGNTAFQIIGRVASTNILKAMSRDLSSHYGKPISILGRTTLVSPNNDTFSMFDLVDGNVTKTNGSTISSIRVDNRTLTGTETFVCGPDPIESTRNPNVLTSFFAVFSGEPNDATAAEILLDDSAFFVPRQIWVPVTAGSSAPSITALSAINITATSAQPRISYS